MKHLIIGLCLLAACGSTKTPEPQVYPGSALQVFDRPEACGGVGGIEFTTFTDPGHDGVFDGATDKVTSVTLLCNGRNGLDGKDGASSSVSVNPAAPGECLAGGYDIVLSRSGLPSVSYPLCNGLDGTNGQDGQDGADAPVSPLAPVQLIAPCGTQSSAWKEQLVLLSNGSLLGSFSANASGLNTRLALLADGSYQDTDDSSCHFSVSTSGLNRTLSWAAQGSFTSGSVSWQVSAGFNPLIGQ